MSNEQVIELAQKIFRDLCKLHYTYMQNDAYVLKWAEQSVKVARIFALVAEAEKGR